MLRKLMKHEIRATLRFMLPLFLIVLVLSVPMSLMVHGLGGGTGVLINLLRVLLVTAYSVAMGAMFILIVVLIVQRFRSNMLGDEGYITMTLPVSVHRLLWSKIIISAMWFVGACIVTGISLLIILASAEDFRRFAEVVSDLWSMLTVQYAVNGVALVLEVLLLCFLSYAVTCLHFYAALATGHGFDRFKMLLSVAFFFAYAFATELLTVLLVTGFVTEGVLQDLDAIGSMDPMTALGHVHGYIWLSIAITAVFGGAYYFVTTYMLQKRRNLE
jgi:hypothetical protein